MPIGYSFLFYCHKHPYHCIDYLKKKIAKIEEENKRLKGLSERLSKDSELWFTRDNEEYTTEEEVVTHDHLMIEVQEILK